MADTEETKKPIEQQQKKSEKPDATVTSREKERKRESLGPGILWEELP